MPGKEDLSTLDDRTIVSRLADTKSELFNLRFQHATGQLTDYKRIRRLRKEVARLLTAHRALEIKAAEALAAGDK